MGKVTKTNVDKKIEDLKKVLDTYLEQNQADQNLLKANAGLLTEKEDLEERLEILLNENKTLRRELKTTQTDNGDLRERLRKAEADNKTYKESIGLIHELKNNLERGLSKLEN